VTNVLVVDDDAVSAIVSSRALTQAGHAVSLARSGVEAIEALQAGDFDVLVTDWMMPDLDGLELIRKVHLRFDPPPATIMMTCLTNPQAREHALESGADEFLAKPARPAELIAAVERSLARRRPHATPTLDAVIPFPRAPAPSASAGLHVPVVVIGANAGGPRALRLLFQSLPAECRGASFVVAQHAQAQMVDALVAKLAGDTTLHVATAGHGHALASGEILVGPGGRHISIAPTGLSVELDAAPERNHVRPSADQLFASAADAFAARCIAIVLTGMGIDGTDGAARVRAAGGTVLVATPGAHVASGMSESAIRAGVGSAVVPLDGLGAALAQCLGRTRSVPRAATAHAG
jgi:two-component system chemotaxis response regulator CheB